MEIKLKRDQAQWIKLSLVLLLALLTKVVFAESGYPSLPTQRLNDPRKSSTSSLSTPAITTPRKLGLDLGIGSGITVWSQSVGNAVNAAMATRVVRALPIYAGIDAAVDFWGSGMAGTPANRTGLQVLATAYYRFEIAPRTPLHPYLGLSAGPHWFLGPASSVVNFELLARPGVSLELSKEFSLALEPKFGLLAVNFAFVPTFGALFTL